MAVNSRQGLMDYALRSLGAPVIEVNADPDQLEDRIDEALEYWHLYHTEGVEKLYLKQRINASYLNLVEPIAETFNLYDVVTGATSGAKATCAIQTNEESKGTKLIIKGIKGTFVAGETISNGTITATLAATPIVLGEVDLKYVDLPDWVYGVTRILPFSGTSTSKSMFDIQYQLRLHDLYDLTSTSIIYYKQVMGHLALLDLELNGRPMFRYNRLQSRIFPDINWDADVAVGDFIVLECYRALDPVAFTRVWSELWLKHYTTALFKKQWAVNLKKFSGLQLPGGVTMDGQGMYDEAIAEIKELEDELQNKASPLEFFMG